MQVEHEEHDTDDRLTACGRKWTAVEAKRRDDQPSRPCLRCKTILRALWKDRG